MRAADLRLGPDRKHFEGVVVVDVKAGSPLLYVDFRKATSTA